MKLSVVIGVYNGEAYIRDQLEALAGQVWSEPWEVVISDNGSTDSTVAIVDGFQGRIPHLRVVDSSDRRGVAHARNVGVAEAVGRSVAFCDADDVVCPGWVAAMGEALESHDLVVGPLDYERLNEPWAQTYRGTHQTEGPGYFRLGHEDFLPYGGGGNLGVKRSAFIGVDGFEEEFRGHEEVDVCFRLQLAGAKLYFAPEAVVHYRLRDSFGELFRRAQYFGTCDVFTYAKWRSFLGPAGGLPRQLLRLVRPFVRLVPLAVRGKGDLARLVWEAGYASGRIRESAAQRVLLLYV
jgi:GT2 family glycosyltransferase